jgi:hypothetical protein
MNTHDALKLLPRLESAPGWGGEHRLLVAVLVRAIADTYQPAIVYNGEARSREQIESEALNWFKLGNIGGITFDRICEELADDADGFKEAVLRKIEKLKRGEDGNVMQLRIGRTEKCDFVGCEVKGMP